MQCRRISLPPPHRRWSHAPAATRGPPPTGRARSLPVPHSGAAQIRQAVDGGRGGLGAATDGAVRASDEELDGRTEEGEKDEDEAEGERLNGNVRDVGTRECI